MPLLSGMVAKPPRNAVSYCLIVQLVELFQASSANTLVLVVQQVLLTGTKNARLLIFAQNDPIPLHRNFDRISFFDVQASAKFDRKDNTTKLIHASDNSAHL